jgi:hypothetical protein
VSTVNAGRAKKLQLKEADELTRSRQGGSAVSAGLVKLGHLREERNFQVEEVIEEVLEKRKTLHKRKRNLFDVSSSDQSES